MCRVRAGLVGDGQSNALASVFMAFLDGEPVCAVGRSRVLKDPIRRQASVLRAACF